MAGIRETARAAGRELTFETGAVARQASGAVLLREGDTVLMAVVTAAGKPTNLPYMPLTVEYRQRLSADGRIPGGYERREAKATSPEILVSRLVDRSVRPFFSDAWRYDTQVMVSPLSYDPSSDLPALSICAASAALAVSDVPFPVPLAGVRVTRRDGRCEAFPAPAAGEPELDLYVSLSPDGIVMVEGGGDEVDEDAVLEAFAVAREAAAPIHAAIERLRAAVGKTARPLPPLEEDGALRARVAQVVGDRLATALAVVGKQDRYAALDALASEVLAVARAEAPAGADPDERAAAAREVLDDLKRRQVRADILEGRRLGGRGLDQVREISGQVGWLPRAHGSSLFSRGETQVLCTATLAGDSRTQRIEALGGDVVHRFLLHYDFPPYCVGEVRPLRGPGRREIGHGALARRALLPVLPGAAEWPFTMRVESTVTESNGSSSMATVCGGSMALLDAGVPLRRPVAGIAMGLVVEGQRHAVLTDILGDEDHVGDMDFKVAGTTQGITAIQLDNKLGSLPLEVMREGLERARAARLHILERMAQVISAPRPEPSPHAPRAAQLRILPGRIRDLIGPGGKMINGIRAATGVEIEVQDDGRVFVFAPPGADLDRAKALIDDAAGLPTQGEVYVGRVVAVKPFGAFVRLFQGVEGLLRDQQPLVGGEVRVLVSGVSDRGKLELQLAQ